MKVIKKTVLLSLIITMLLANFSLAEETYGATAVKSGQTYTTEQMLTYALQDEYLAQAEYQAFVASFGENSVFSRLKKAEANHAARLEHLMKEKEIAIPENTAAALVTVPATIELAFLSLVAHEKINIEMYQTFLTQENLSDDLKLVFTALLGTSENHLKAGMRQVEKAAGLRQGMQNAAGPLNGSEEKVPGSQNSNRQNRKNRFGPQRFRQDRGNNARNNKGFMRHAPCTNPNCPCYNAQPTPAPQDNPVGN